MDADGQIAMFSALMIGVKLSCMVSLIQLGKKPMPARQTIRVAVENRSHQVASVSVR